MSGIILAGGQSQRMGRPKGLLRLGGQSIIERVVATVAAVTQEVLVVTNEPGTYRHLELPLVTDRFQGKGPLAGIHAGLVAATWERSVVLACDLPFIEAPLLQYLLDVGEDWAAIVPVVRGFPEPLAAVYSKSCLPAIEGMLVGGDRPKVTDCYSLVPTRFVAERELSRLANVSRAFWNVNTPSDWDLARKWIEEKAQSR